MNCGKKRFCFNSCADIPCGASPLTRSVSNTSHLIASSGVPSTAAYRAWHWCANSEAAAISAIAARRSELDHLKRCEVQSIASSGHPGRRHQRGKILARVHDGSTIVSQPPRNRVISGRQVLKDMVVDRLASFVFARPYLQLELGFGAQRDGEVTLLRPRRRIPNEGQAFRRLLQASLVALLITGGAANKCHRLGASAKRTRRPSEALRQNAAALP